MVEVVKGKATEKYDVGEIIGRGKFSTVKLCTEKESGKEFAVKILRTARRGCSRDAILNEVSIMNMCVDCMYVLKLVEVFDGGREFHLVEELAECGDLYSRCLAEENHAEESEVRHYIKQLISALVFIHERNIVHCDIKPENVLVTRDDTDNIRLVDFGLARVVSPKDKVCEIVGTTEYVAPEILSFEPITAACDMWSLGVLAYTLLSGISPFLGDNDSETYANISHCDYDFDDEVFDLVSDDAQHFISELLEVKPRIRPSAHEMSTHSWMQAAFVSSSIGGGGGKPESSTSAPARTALSPANSNNNILVCSSPSSSSPPTTTPAGGTTSTRGESTCNESVVDQSSRNASIAGGDDVRRAPNLQHVIVERATSLPISERSRSSTNIFTSQDESVPTQPREASSLAGESDIREPVSPIYGQFNFSRHRRSQSCKSDSPAITPPSPTDTCLPVASATTTTTSPSPPIATVKLPSPAPVPGSNKNEGAASSPSYHEHKTDDTPSIPPARDQRALTGTRPPLSPLLKQGVDAKKIIDGLPSSGVVSRSSSRSSVSGTGRPASRNASAISTPENDNSTPVNGDVAPPARDSFSERRASRPGNLSLVRAASNANSPSPSANANVRLAADGSQNDASPAASELTKSASELTKSGRRSVTERNGPVPRSPARGGSISAARIQSPSYVISPAGSSTPGNRSTSTSREISTISPAGGVSGRGETDVKSDGPLTKRASQSSLSSGVLSGWRSQSGSTSSAGDGDSGGVATRPAYVPAGGGGGRRSRTGSASSLADVPTTRGNLRSPSAVHGAAPPPVVTQGDDSTVADPVSTRRRRSGSASGLADQPPAGSTTATAGARVSSAATNSSTSSAAIGVATVAGDSGVPRTTNAGHDSTAGGARVVATKPETGSTVNSRTISSSSSNSANTLSSSSSNNNGTRNNGSSSGHTTTVAKTNAIGSSAAQTGITARTTLSSTAVAESSSSSRRTRSDAATAPSVTRTRSSGTSQASNASTASRQTADSQSAKSTVSTSLARTSSGPLSGATQRKLSGAGRRRDTSPAGSHPTSCNTSTPMSRSGSYGTSGSGTSRGKTSSSGNSDDSGTSPRPSISSVASVDDNAILSDSTEPSRDSSESYSATAAATVAITPVSVPVSTPSQPSEQDSTSATKTAEDPKQVASTSSPSDKSAAVTASASTSQSKQRPRSSTRDLDFSLTPRLGSFRKSSARLSASQSDISRINNKSSALDGSSGAGTRSTESRSPSVATSTATSVTPATPPPTSTATPATPPPQPLPVTSKEQRSSASSSQSKPAQPRPSRDLNPSAGAAPRLGSFRRSSSSRASQSDFSRVNKYTGNATGNASESPAKVVISSRSRASSSSSQSDLTPAARLSSRFSASTTNLSPVAAQPSPRRLASASSTPRTLSPADDDTAQQSATTTRDSHRSAGLGVSNRLSASQSDLAPRQKTSRASVSTCNTPRVLSPTNEHAHDSGRTPRAQHDNHLGVATRLSSSHSDLSFGNRSVSPSSSPFQRLAPVDRSRSGSRSRISRTVVSDSPFPSLSSPSASPLTGAGVATSRTSSRASSPSRPASGASAATAVAAHRQPLEKTYISWRSRVKSPTPATPVADGSSKHAGDGRPAAADEKHRSASSQGLSAAVSTNSSSRRSSATLSPTTPSPSHATDDDAHAHGGMGMKILRLESADSGHALSDSDTVATTGNNGASPPACVSPLTRTARRTSESCSPDAAFDSGVSVDESPKRDIGPQPPPPAHRHSNGSGDAFPAPQHGGATSAADDDDVGAATPAVLGESFSSWRSRIRRSSHSSSLASGVGGSRAHSPSMRVP